MAGKARPGAAWQGLARHGRAGSAGQGRPGKARLGEAWRGMAWQGKAGMAWQGEVRRGLARPGMV